MFKSTKTWKMVKINNSGESIGLHYVGYVGDDGRGVVVGTRRQFFIYKIHTVNEGELTLGTHVFRLEGVGARQCLPYTFDGSMARCVKHVKYRGNDNDLIEAALAVK